MTDAPAPGSKISMLTTMASSGDGEGGGPDGIGDVPYVAVKDCVGVVDRHFVRVPVTALVDIAVVDQLESADPVPTALPVGELADVLVQADDLVVDTNALAEDVEVSLAMALSVYCVDSLDKMILVVPRIVMVSDGCAVRDGQLALGDGDAREAVADGEDVSLGSVENVGVAC